MRTIAEELGRPISTVAQWLDPDSAAKLRARKKRYAGICADCGAATTGTASGVVRAARWCRVCGERHAKENLRTHMAARHAERDRLIERWWNEGLTLREIAARLGWSLGHLQQEVHRLRVRGYSLPYRRSAAARLRMVSAKREKLGPDHPLTRERLRLSAEGVSLAEIARRQGVTPQAVAATLDRYAQAEALAA